MEELRKIGRVVEREYPEAALSALLVIDATTGQNGLAQAKVFGEVANLDGIILTKLDGTAKGGIAIAIRSELGLPVRYIGLGEKLDDMQPFDARAFVTRCSADSAPRSFRPAPPERTGRRKARARRGFVPFALFAVLEAETAVFANGARA